MKRKAIAMAMAMMMIASAASVCSAASVTDFKDVPSTSWYYTSVKGAVDDGYMNGVSNDTFAPSNNLTRAMFATILARYDKATVDNTAKSNFTDVQSNQWYTGSVVWGSNNGIINGYSATKFGTNDFIKREDLALMVYRYVNFKKYTLKEKTPVTFKDADQISAYAKEALEYCRVHGLFIGDQNGYLHPQKLITRAEAAAVMERIDLVIKESTGGSSGGGGGGHTTAYTRADYSVYVSAAKSGFSGTPEGWATDRTGTDLTKYHVTYADGTYTASNSDDITLVKVAKDVADGENIESIMNYVKGKTFTDQKGNVQMPVDADGNIQEITVKYVPVADVIKADDTATINSIVDSVNNSLPTGSDAVVAEDVTSLINKLDEGITSKDELTTEEQKIAEQVVNKVSGMTEDQLMEKVKQIDGAEAMLDKAGLDKTDLKKLADEYSQNLADILGITLPTTHAASLYAADATSSTEGGIAVKVNPVTVAQNQYKAKTLDQFIDDYFPTNSYVTKDELKANADVQALFALSEPEKLVDGSETAGYKLKSGDAYNTIAETAIDHINNLRTTYVVGQDADKVKDLLGKAIAKANNRAGSEVISIDDATLTKLAKVAVKPAPTLEDLRTEGLIGDDGKTYTITREISSDTIAKYINRIMGRLDVSADDSLVSNVADKAAGEYTLTVTISREDCSKSSAH